MNTNKEKDTWTKKFTKTVSSSYQAAQNKFSGKAQPIPNDPLDVQRVELSEYHQYCIALQGDAQQLSQLTEICAAKRSKTLQLLDVLNNAEHATPEEYRNVLPSYAEAWDTIIEHNEVTIGKLEQRLFELKNRISQIQGVQKMLEERDKSHKKCQDERKKMDKARENATNDAAWEKSQQKVQKAEEEFQSTSFDVSNELNFILAGRRKFLNELLTSLLEIQKSLFGKAEVSLSKLNMEETTL